MPFRCFSVRGAIFLTAPDTLGFCAGDRPGVHVSSWLWETAGARQLKNRLIEKSDIHFDFFRQ
jgi:hypothetical protein